MSIAKSDLESQRRRRSGNVDGTSRSLSETSSDFPNPNLLSLSDFPKPSPNPRRRGRKPNPNPRRWRWGRLSREDWGKLSPKEKEDWGKLSLTERRELLLLIKEEAEQKEEIKQQHKKEQKKAHQLLIRKAVQLFISDASVTPNTTKEELSLSPTVVHSSSDLWCWEEMIREAEQLYLPASPTVAPNTTKKELSTVVHSLSEITTTKEELLAPPTSQEHPWQSILGCSEAEWIAELQSMGNICEICGHTNHLTVECSYLVEIPLDAKIVNESAFLIACKYCSMPLVTGACVNECDPPTRRKVIPNPLDCWPFGGLPRKELFAKDLPNKELFAPPSSEMVVHSSSEETATPCIHGLSSSSSLKLNGELHARATTPPFAFPEVPACIPGLSSSSSLKLNGELHARATTKPFAFPYMPACKSNKSAFCSPDVPAMPDVKCQICGANHWSAVCFLVTGNPAGCKSYQ